MPSPYYSNLITLPESREYSSTEKLCTMEIPSSKPSKLPTWCINLSKKTPLTTLSKNPINSLSRSLSQTLSHTLRHAPIVKPSRTSTKNTMPKLRRVPTPYPQNVKPGLCRTLSQHLPKNPLPELRRSLANNPIPSLRRGLSERISTLSTRHPSPLDKRQAGREAGSQAERHGNRETLSTHCSTRCWCKDLSLHPEIRFAWEHLFCRAHDFESGVGYWSGGSSVYDGDSIHETEGSVYGDETWGKQSWEGGDEKGNKGIEVNMKTREENEDVMEMVQDYKRCVQVEGFGRMAEWRRDY